MRSFAYAFIGLLSLATRHIEASEAHTPILESAAHDSSYVEEHLKDSHTWHLLTIGNHHLTWYLPVILYKKGEGMRIFSSHRFWDANHQPIEYKGFYLERGGKIVSTDGKELYDFSVTKNVASLLVAICILLLLFLSMAASYQRSGPYGLRRGWILLDLIIHYIRDQVARPCIGEKHYLEFTPYLLTIFFYIAFNNLLGLLPGAANVTGNISVALALGGFILFLIVRHAPAGYWQHIINPPSIPKWLLPIMIPVEIMGLFTKFVTLTMRLFCNILAGHLGLLSILSIVFTLKPYIFAAAVSIPLAVFMTLLEVFVALLQAYLFTLFSALSLGAAVVMHHPAHSRPHES